MKKSFDILAAHCLATLPDSVLARRELINALLAHLTEDHPAFRKLTLLIRMMDEQDALQLQLFEGFNGKEAA